MMKNIRINIINQDENATGLIYRLFETISEQSPSDSNVFLECEEQNKKFIGEIKIISSSLQVTIKSDSDDLISLINILKKLFNTEITNWRKERIL